MTLKNYLQPQKGAITLNIIVKALGTLCEVILPSILAYIVNEYLPLRQTSGVIRYGLLMVFFAFLAWILNVAANRISARISASIIKAIRSDLFAKSLALSAQDIDELGVSSLESRLTTDTYNIHRFLGAVLRMGIRALLMFLGGIVFCFILNSRLALVLAFLLPLTIICARIILAKVFPLFRHLQDEIDQMVQLIRENIRGIRVIKALDKVSYEQERFARQNKKVSQAEIDSIDELAKLSPTINIILFTGLGVVILVSAYFANRGLIASGTVLAFISYFIQITNSLLALNRLVNMSNRAQASWERIEEVFQKETPLSQQYLALPKKNRQVPELEFRNVSFTYKTAEAGIENISFKLYPGESLGIMGATGAGKSTLIRLILRQYAPQAGQILFRGVDLAQLDPAEVHAEIGVVFQNDFLFGQSIRENIAFGRELAEQEVSEATKVAQAADFIAEKDQGLDFELASRGVNLSGGQKQRLLISRALADSPSILILDDASSALDFKTDAKLRQSLQQEYPGLTSIIIAQRVSSLYQADQILIIEKGRLVATGTHEELLKTNALYQRISKNQMEQAALEKEGA